jgi:hypothetical protein
LRLHWEECVFVRGGPDASPSGELPILMHLNESRAEIVPLHKLHRLVVTKFNLPGNVRVTAYLNLLDTKIHAAWVHFQGVWLSRFTSFI